MIDSPLLRKTTDNILPCLKNHLATQLPGAVGGMIRGEMLEKIFKEYPSWRAKKTYQDIGDSDDLAANQEASFRAMEMQNAGKKFQNHLFAGRGTSSLSHHYHCHVRV